jgi:hypothetical protein
MFGCMCDVIFRKSAHEIIAMIVPLKSESRRKWGEDLLVAYFDAVGKAGFFGCRFKVFRKELSLFVKVVSFSDVDEDIRFRTLVFLDEFRGIVFSPFRFIIRSKVSRKGLYLDLDCKR